MVLKNKKIVGDESMEEREAKEIWNWYKKAARELSDIETRLSGVFRSAPAGILPLFNRDDDKAISMVRACKEYAQSSARNGWEMFID